MRKMLHSSHVEARIELYDHANQPSREALDDASALFRATIPVFDDINAIHNPKMIEARKDGHAYRKLLHDRTILLAHDTHERVIGLLECDVRPVGDAQSAYIIWLMTDPAVRGKRISSKLHQAYERTFVPSVVEATGAQLHQALTVHLQNPAVGIYEKWGYQPAQVRAEQQGRVVMIKPAAL